MAVRIMFIVILTAVYFNARIFVVQLCVGCYAGALLCGVRLSVSVLCNHLTVEEFKNLS